MRTAFITGSLEPGRDGVGDYTRRLAAECIRQGHPSIIIGLNDSYVSEVFSGSQGMENIPISAFRLPAALSWSERASMVRRWLAAFDPDWVSLQFVCYAFHSKGFVNGLASKLAPLRDGRKLHIMFHEIWLCKELGWGWKQCAVGALQRHFIQHFVRSARPNVMHTSNPTYAALLGRSGIPVTELGLFGNVPVVSEPDSTWIESQLQTALGVGYCREAVWLFGLFGALHSQWPPEPLLTHLQRAAQAAGKKPVFLSIGRIGNSGANLWNRIAQQYADRFTFLRFGEQPAKHISEYLSFIDCGIATTPRSIIGKSGTVTSMLEHGLPVIVNRDDAPGVKSGIWETDPLLIRCGAHLEALLQTKPAKGPRLSRQSQIAKGFLLSLQEAF